MRARFTLGIHLVFVTLCNGLSTSCAPAPSDPQFGVVEWETGVREVWGAKPLIPIGLAPWEHTVVVLLFIAPDCPISNAYAPEIARLIDAYSQRGVAFRVVHSDPRVTEDIARKHAKDFNLRCQVLLDSKQEIARAAGATVTPEAAVLNSKGERVYLGRIDDLFYSFGKRRAAPTTRELRDALDAVLAGQPVAKATAPALGCEIPPP